MKMKTNLLVFAAVLLAMNVTAQTEDQKWGLGINGGIQQYDGDFGAGFYNFEQSVSGFGGISISRYLTAHFDLELNATYGSTAYHENDINNFEYNLFQYNINAKYNFFKYDDVKFRPFVFLGIGNSHFSDKDSDRKFTTMTIPNFGAGITYKVSPLVSVVFRENFMYTTYDNMEYETGGPNDMFLQHSIGIVFNIGKIKDNDGDGVSNRNDLCPELPGIEMFDGCPDTDGDGIKDADDKCPNYAGTVALSGCPDNDGDGVADADDLCPDQAGPLNGCPDSDGDGVADKDDKCPNAAGLAELQGCPDADGDGVADADDLCPNQAGPLNGCPDTDGDGVADKDDICPNEAGILANKGCPEIKEEVVKVLAQALHGVKFQSGKAIITKSSYPTLDNIVSILKDNPEYNLKIEGHSDSQGNDDLNLKISKDRAAAVKSYLINKGINDNRIASEGYGESKPIADNATAAGRAENRRVEMTIQF